jgi:hypothetical protein
VSRNVIDSQICRTDDAPYYYRGNKALISICALTLVVLLLQGTWLAMLNKREQKIWAEMTIDEKAQYQADIEARERDRNRRLKLRFEH